MIIWIGTTILEVDLTILNTIEKIEDEKQWGDKLALLDSLGIHKFLPPMLLSTGSRDPMCRQV